MDLREYRISSDPVICSQRSGLATEKRKLVASDARIRKRKRKASMPGMIAPSDYSQEPARHPALKINAKVTMLVV